MPRGSLNKGRVVRKVHIKFESMAPKTLIKYKLAVRRFFWWRKSAGFPYPGDLTELDYQVGEFFNHLYLDESPLGWAQDCISGLKRLFPRCRRHLETATLYYGNWVKATKRVKALPFTPQMVRGMSAFSLIKGNANFAACILIMFAGLLRIGETLGLKLRHINCVKENFAIISLWWSKGAQRTGEPEVVFIRDRVLIRVINSLKKNSSAEGSLFNGSYREFCSRLQDASAFFGLAHPNLTPHGLRRGGATWHFSLFFNYDRTQQHGRWKQQQTAKGYIDEAMAELGQASLPAAGKARLHRAEALLPELLASNFP
jgi:integrase